MFIWRFGDAEFDESRWELRRGGRSVDLEPRPLDLLLYLLQNAGQAVTKDALLDAVYGHRHVGEGALANLVAKLRRALGDRGPEVIATVQRVGYRFAAPVVRVELPPTVHQAVAFKAGDSPPRRRGWRLIQPLGPTPDRDVWLAEHTKTGERRVFKFCADGARLGALKREVALYRVLNETLGDHGGFVRVLHWDLEQTPYFIEYEYGGLNLYDWALSLGGLHEVTLDRRIALVADIAEAVAAAHWTDVLLRDLNPANLLVHAGADGQWHARLTDFGSSHLLDTNRLANLSPAPAAFEHADGNAKDGSASGPHYLAPELIDGGLPSVVSDVYALGVMLYQMSVGDLRRPLAPGWEDNVGDAVLRIDIAEAAHGNPAKRMPFARTLAMRLRELDERRAEFKRARLREHERTVSKQRAALASARRPWMFAAGVALSLLAIAAAASIYLARSAAHTRAKLDAITPTLAVLPLVNDTGDADNDYLAVGLSDQLTDTLARLTNLRVTSRSSSFKIKDRGIGDAAIAGELGVRDLLDGRLQKTGDQLSITLHLFDVGKDGEIWSEHYESTLDGIALVQTDVVRSVAGALKLLPPTAAAIQPPTGNAEAYNDYLQGLFYFGRFSIDGFHKSIGYLTEATRLDSNYAAAFSELSTVWSSLADRLGGPEAADANQKARAAAMRALALDPTLGQAHEALGWLLMNVDWNFPAAISELRRANELPPVTSRSRTSLAVAMADTGNLEAAVTLTREAIVINPLASHAYYDLAGYLITLGRYEEAAQALSKAIDLQPSGTGNYALLAVNEIERGNASGALKAAQQEPDEIWQAFAVAVAQDAIGNRELADAALTSLTKQHADDAPMQIADIYANRREADTAFSWLDKAYAERDPGLLGLRFDCFFVQYRSDPRYAGMARKLGVME